jgi:hypothetical protein
LIDGVGGDLDPATAEAVQMAKFRMLVPMTYEQYLDEPEQQVLWVLHIDQEVSRKKQEQQT